MKTRRFLQTLLALSLIAGAARSAPERPPLELNTASRAQLESLRGLGPALVERMLAARQRAPFSGWDDLRRRVRGIGPALAQQLSEQGLRVAGEAWPAAPAVAASA